MKIKGFTKLSLIDFPNQICSTIFLASCNLRCHYCYNKDLVLNSPQLPEIELKSIFQYLKKRKKVIDGVCVTGGEPTLNADLPQLLKKIKSLDYLIKLDTNGSNPRLLKKLLKEKLVDYLAVDFKAPLDGRYQKLTGNPADFLPKFAETLKLVARSNVSFELRTTVIPSVHDAEILSLMAKQISALLGRRALSFSFRWFLQPFKPLNCLNAQFNLIKPFSEKEMKEMALGLKKVLPGTRLR